MSIVSDVREHYLGLVTTAITAATIVSEGTTYKQKANETVVRIKVFPRETVNETLGVNGYRLAAGLVSIEVISPRTSGVAVVEDACQALVDGIPRTVTAVTSGSLQTFAVWAETTDEEDIYLRGKVFIRWSLRY